MRGFKIGLAYCLTLSLAIVLMSQACGDSFQAKSRGVVSSSQTSTGGGGGITPPPAPSGDVPELKTWNDSYPLPVRADDCLTNAKYNLCLTRKDPVSTFGMAFSPAFTTATATPQQESRVFVYGVKVPAQGPLTNDNFTLNPGSSTAVSPLSNGGWKHQFRGDTNHYVSQLHAWYWINWLRSYALARTQTFHASASKATRKLVIRPAEDVENNAYFDSFDYSMSIGWSNVNQGGQRADLSLDVATILHELGHANYYIANKSSIDGDFLTLSCFNGQTGCCTNRNGCPAAIHEGVADFHAKLAFPSDDGSILDYFFNNPAGDQWRDLDWIQSNNITAQQLFDRSTRGEIHDMGTVYASIWYGVWKKAKAAGTEVEIEKLFIEHLAGIGGSDTFITAFSTISAMAGQLFPAKADSMRADFRAEYTRLGLTVP